MNTEEGTLCCSLTGTLVQATVIAFTESRDGRCDNVTKYLPSLLAADSKVITAFCSEEQVTSHNDLLLDTSHGRSQPVTLFIPHFYKDNGF